VKRRGKEGRGNAPSGFDAKRPMPASLVGRATVGRRKGGEGRRASILMCGVSPGAKKERKGDIGDLPPPRKKRKEGGKRKRFPDRKMVGHRPRKRVFPDLSIRGGKEGVSPLRKNGTATQGKKKGRLMN